MGKWMLVLAVTLVQTAAMGQKMLPLAVKVDDPKLYYVGRIDRRDPTGPNLQWSGCMVTIRFRGTSLQAAINGGDDQYYEVVTDGVKHEVIHPVQGGSVVDLAKDLPEGEHTVQVMKRTEASTGAGHFSGYYLNAGGELLEPQRLSRKIEVIGDSVVCGYGNEGADEKEHFVAAHENAWMTYGAIVAREMAAEYVCVGWSWRKMWPDNMISEIYDLTVPWDPGSRWDFPQYQPDAVLINLAGNDFGQGAPDEVKWSAAYKDFLRHVRKNYPQAMIYIASGCMMSDDWPPEKKVLSVLKRYLQRIEDEMKAEGEMKIRQIHFDTQNGQVDGVGGDWHPSIKTHQKMAAKWEAALERDLGWKPVK